MDNKNKIAIIVKAMSDKFAENIVAIDMRQASPIFDTFILCSASNQRLMNAMRDAIEDSMAQNGFDVNHVEGLRDSKWLLMDFGEVIVHIFEAEERKAYSLEKLWADMPTVDIEAYL